jgi:ABC-type glycerol-3-phosphate transport system permease component
MSSKALRGTLSGRVVAWVIVLVFVVAGIFPVYWMITSSLKSKQELFTSKAPLTVAEPSFSEYQQLFETKPFGYWFANSVGICLTATLISLVLGSLAAYGINRSPSRTGVKLAQIALAIYVIPRAIFAVPFFILLNKIGLLNTRLGVVFAFLTFTLPFTIWLLVGFFDSIPRELDDAAMVDGCSRIGTLVRVILPLSLAGIVTVGIYIFTDAWNDFMYPLALIQSPTKTTVTVGVTGMRQGDVLAWGQIMGAGTIVTLPVMVFYMTIYKRIAGGVISGSVKG